MDEVRRFSSQTRALEKEGYLVYELSGQSIRSFKEAGRPFQSTWHKDYPHLENLTSSKTEFAIDPQKLVLPKSNNKTLKEQEEMVREFSLRLARKIPGVEAIIGESPDYVELVFLHLDKTGQRLFGEKYDYSFTRTKTPVDSSSIAVGNFQAEYGLEVFRCRSDEDRRVGVWIAPLVVPK